MPVALSVAMFGALGAVSRYGVDLLVERHTETVFPLGTLVINLSGCLLAGAAVGGLVDRLHEPTWLTVGVVTGFLGGYTTFSMFAYETHDLIREGHVGLAAVNALGSVAAGVAGVYAGLLVTGR
jgi:fluoride exporter